MNLRHVFYCLFSIIGYVAFAGMSVEGSRYVTVIPAKTTGLEAVLVAENAEGARLVYNASSTSAASSVKWMRFGVSGGGYAQEISGATVSGATSSITLQSGDAGYIVDDGGRQLAWWVIDYAGYEPDMTAFAINGDSDCDRVFFTPTGGFERMLYYSVTGVPTELDREIKLTYTDLEAVGTTDGDDTEGAEMSWQPVNKTVDFSSISGVFSVSAPLCNTQFHLTGDRFLSEWGSPISLMSESYTAVRVEANTWAIQEARDADNEQNSSASGLGGSAPCVVTFGAAVTDAAVFTEWQFSTTEDFDDVLYRFSETDFTYTFNEYGTTYVRFTCADASGQCTYDGDVYTVTVGESKLQCPNAFSPHNQDGVNDEWKVSYSSLTSYECHIFNRWGKELFRSTNPAEGWDGRVGGKFVLSGVYFYVIKAVGADGVKYNLNGDINIIGSKLRTDNSQSVE